MGIGLTASCGKIHWLGLAPRAFDMCFRRVRAFVDLCVRCLDDDPLRILLSQVMRVSCCHWKWNSCRFVLLSFLIRFDFSRLPHVTIQGLTLVKTARGKPSAGPDIFTKPCWAKAPCRRVCGASGQSVESQCGTQGFVCFASEVGTKSWHELEIMNAVLCFLKKVLVACG